MAIYRTQEACEDAWVECDPDSETPEGECVPVRILREADYEMLVEVIEAARAASRFQRFARTLTLGAAV